MTSVLGSLLVYEGGVGGTQSALLADEGDFGGTLVSLCGYFWHAMVTLGQLWGHIWHMRVPLGILWCHFGVTLDPLWGLFRYIRVLLCHFTSTVESQWSHFGCIKVDFQQKKDFPIDLYDFIKLGGRFRVTLGQFLAYEGGFGSISVPFRGQFGVTFGIRR